MRFPIISLTTFLLASIISSSGALQALTNSPCASECGNVLSETSGRDEITCFDRDYGLTPKANVFSSCINCQLSSKYVDLSTNQTDLQWALYNLRYAVSWCVFGSPNNTDFTSTPCMSSTACGSLENAFDFDSRFPGTAYRYCSLMYAEILPRCTACLSQSDDTYITNFVTVLFAACQQQPIPGATISIEGNLFTKVRVNITEPNSTTKSSSTTNSSPTPNLNPTTNLNSTTEPSPTTNPNIAADPYATPSSKHQPATGGLLLGAKIGIAVAALAITSTIIGCCIVFRVKQRRKRNEKSEARAAITSELGTERVPEIDSRPIEPAELETERRPELEAASQNRQ